MQVLQLKGYPVLQQNKSTWTDELKSIIANNEVSGFNCNKGRRGEASIESAKALLCKGYLSAAWDFKQV